MNSSKPTPRIVLHQLLFDGHSQVLEAHRRVKVSKDQGFAELGIRTANAAMAFSESYDPDGNQYVLASFTRQLENRKPHGCDCRPAGALWLASL